jgi:hypothetical protein
MPLSSNQTSSKKDQSVSKTNVIIKKEENLKVCEEGEMCTCKASEKGVDLYIADSVSTPHNYQQILN